jgi:hypothetical protein
VVQAAGIEGGWEVKIALVTTTINVPRVLELYRAYAGHCGSEVVFFVALDDKTPWDKFTEINNCIYRLPDIHDERYKSSALIGRNTPARRSLAILDALAWGAEIIVTVDDDNYPMTPDYFERFEGLLTRPFSGLCAYGEWFDPGILAFPLNGETVVQRGFPQDRVSAENFHIAFDVKVGVATGYVLGTPDTSAVDHLSRRPVVHQVSEVARAGYVVDPKTHTIFNTQNTAFIRELAPCFLLIPAFGRYDDIFASLICRRVMLERGLYLHYGQPFVWQQRNDHDLIQDLRAEILGMERVDIFAESFDRCAVDGTVMNMVEQLYVELGPPIPDRLIRAWREDVESVL